MQTSKDILQSALDDDHRSLSLKALKEVRLNIETLAKLFVTMGLTESQDMDKTEYEEFMAWKQNKTNTKDLDLSKLSPQARSAMEEVARLRLKEQTDMGLYSKDTQDQQDDVVIISETIVDVGPVPDTLDSPPVPVRRPMRRKKKP